MKESHNNTKDNPDYCSKHTENTEYLLSPSSETIQTLVAMHYGCKSTHGEETYYFDVLLLSR